MILFWCIIIILYNPHLNSFTSLQMIDVNYKLFKCYVDRCCCLAFVFAYFIRLNEVGQVYMTLNELLDLSIRTKY